MLGDRWYSSPSLRRQPTLIEHYGPVDTDPASHMWIGATAATNNTGELTGIYAALQTAQAHAEPGDAVRILPVSMIALCTTTGAWKPRKNKALAGRNAKLLAYSPPSKRAALPCTLYARASSQTTPHE